MIRKAKTPAIEIASNATAEHEQTPQTPLEAQQQIWNFWLEAMDPLGFFQRAPNRLADASPDAERPTLAEREMEEVILLEDKSAPEKSEQPPPAIDPAPVSLLLQGPAQFMQLWQYSLDMMRLNAEALVQMNSQILAMWMGSPPTKR